MQNKPNLLDAQMNVTSFYTVDYENKSNWNLVKTKPIKANTNPIQTQFAERPPDVQIAVTLVKTRNYNNELWTMNYYANLSAIALAKAEQTQSNPIFKNSAPFPTWFTPLEIPAVSKADAGVLFLTGFTRGWLSVFPAWVCGGLLWLCDWHYKSFAICLRSHSICRKC